jgi:hypothetical protein
MRWELPRPRSRGYEGRATPRGRQLASNHPGIARVAVVVIPAVGANTVASCKTGAHSGTTPALTANLPAR